MDNKDKAARSILKDNLLRLNKQQLKLFYGMLVHAWASQKAFISTRSFFNLWCELNYLCAEADEGFPDPYDDHELLKSFCKAHPYYFIDILSPEAVINLFCQYLDDKLDVLAGLADKLHTGDLRATYEYSNKALGLTEDVDRLVTDAEEHIKFYS